jgi:hypothetical protein
VAVLAAVGLGSWWTLTTDFFGVARVESGAYRFTAQADLEVVLAEFLGRNIWTLKTAEIHARVVSLPWVRDLTVRRRLPDTVAVDFVEWRPLLQVAVEGRRADSRPLVLIEDGRVLAFPEHTVMAGLPLLVGIAPVRQGDDGPLALPADRIPQVMELIFAMEDAGLESVCPVDFIVARPAGYAIVLQDQRGTLMVGQEDFTDRLNRYMTARDHLEAGLEIDLRFKERITVKRPS